MKDKQLPLRIMIPEIPVGASFTHHPISRSQTPKFYRPYELTDVGTGSDSSWIAFFEEIVLGIYWKTEKPVPYVFETIDGVTRSLDAGCIKWLSNREPQALKCNLDKKGYIESVTPSSELQQRYEHVKLELIDQVSTSKKRV